MKNMEGANRPVLINSSSGDSNHHHDQADLNSTSRRLENDGGPSGNKSPNRTQQMLDEELLEDHECCNASSTTATSSGGMATNGTSERDGNCCETSPTSGSETAGSSKELESPNVYSARGTAIPDALERYSQLMQLLPCLRWFTESAIVELFFRFLYSLITILILNRSRINLFCATIKYPYW
jgi:hypothetical protein